MKLLYYDLKKKRKKELEAILSSLGKNLSKQEGDKGREGKVGVRNGRHIKRNMYENF